MISLFRKHGTITGAWTFGTWHECLECESRWRCSDRISAALWLHGFNSYDLRRIAHRYADGSSLSRLNDQKVIEQLAGLIVSGYLRVHRAGYGNDARSQRSDADHVPSAEQKVVRRLRLTAQDFIFEGRRLRIIRADQWASLRKQNEGRYQVVHQDEAQKLLHQMADWPAILVDEKTAIKEAASLVPDTRGRQIATGILLLRIIPQSAPRPRSSSGPAVTPSQLFGRTKQDDKDDTRQPGRDQPAPPSQVGSHWIEIELVDSTGRPVANARYRLMLPDGVIREGTLGSNGTHYEGDILPGKCRVSFPDFDGKEWRVA